MKKCVTVILLLLLPSCAWFRSARKTDTSIVNSRNPYYLYLAGRWAVMSGDTEKGIKYYENLLRLEPNNFHIILELAMLYFEVKRDVRKTYSLLKRAVALAPDNLEVLMSAGELAMALNKLKEAESMFLNVLEINPEEQQALFYLGTIKYYTRDYPSAKHYFNQLLVLNPRSHLAYYYLANIAVREGNIDEAKKYYEKAIEINPQFKNALLELARLYTLTDIDKAIELYNKILEYAPLMRDLDVAQVRENLANLYISKMKYDKAVEQLEEVEKTSPAVEVKWKLGLLYLELQEYEKAKKEFEFILSLQPENKKVLLYHAYALLNLGEEEKAIEEFAQFTPLDPFYENARVQMALIYFSKGNKEAGFKILEELREKKKTLPDVYYLLGSGYREEYRMEDALNVLKEGYTYYPDNKDIVFLYCAVLEEVGNVDESLKVMEKFSETHSDDADALNFLGYVLLDHDIDIQRAETLIEKAYKLKPTAPHIIDSMGWVYFKKGDYQRAYEFINKALKINPRDGIVWEHLGDILLKMGKVEEAVSAYTKALAQELRNRDKKRIESKLEKVKSGLTH